ncbi:hypothetical protein N0V86_006342 [Didymella sp. IMI 355093]|nr:hypothetical protein N0V86_006342 [Didymella sp. IMI 355093]
MLFPTALLALAACASAASQIALFTDAHCQDSYKGLEGPNGYPNGSCTDMRRSGAYGSLQVVGLDPGCAVTIYAQDDSTTICGGLQEEIQLGQCWNSSWVYYSIDMCDVAGLSIATITTASPTGSSTSPFTNTAHGLTTGTLVGAVLGGLAAGALLLGAALWVLARKKRARKARAAAEHEGTEYQGEGSWGGGYAAVNRVEADTNPYRNEMDASYQRHEMAQGKVVYKHDAAEVAPVELSGGEVDVVHRSSHAK